MSSARVESYYREIFTDLTVTPEESDEIKEKITTLLSLSSSDQNRIEVESVSEMADESTISAKIKILPAQGTGRMLRRSEISTINHSVDLFRQLQTSVEKNLNSHESRAGKSENDEKNERLGSNRKQLEEKHRLLN